MAIVHCQFPVILGKLEAFLSILLTDKGLLGGDVPFKPVSTKRRRTERKESSFPVSCSISWRKIVDVANLLARQFIFSLLSNLSSVCLGHLERGLLVREPLSSYFGAFFAPNSLRR